MAITYGKKKHKQTNILNTVVTVVLLCTVFLVMINHFYLKAEEEAYENLHVQTKQIKDDMQLQLLSDRENLATMANFAAKLYSDGDGYGIMFESFKPIGLIENIGILNPDNTFVTEAGAIDLDGRISFEEEAAKGEYISGRVPDLTRDNYEIIRSAVPIKAGHEVVGILYGVIKLDVLAKKYNNMAKELDAQLFVYDKKSGNLVIDTINDTLGNISFLKERKYNDGYSYEKMMSEDKGFTSFVSAYTGENLYVHYSALEGIDWMITLARYDSQVFAKTHAITGNLFVVFSVMAVIMILYVVHIMAIEKNTNNVMACASSARKLLLEINRRQDNILEALKQVCLLGKARSAIFFDTDGEDYHYSMPEYESTILLGEKRKYFISVLLHYSAELHKVNKTTVGVMCIKPNKHLSKTNPEFYGFLKEHGIREVSFGAVTSKNNRVTILGAVNPGRSRNVRMLIEDVAVCFSIALYNKKHLNRTEIAAATDSLTGVSNRVTYKKDVLMFDEMKPERFSCVYIDVNELHIRNNKYGHAAGDEMLLYIANTLKEIFFGHHIYRMGGDEFLVFVHDTEKETVDKNVDLLTEQLKPMDYHVAVGTSYRTQNTNTEEMVKEAEVRMYEAKSQYYQNKEKQNSSKKEDRGYVYMKTGIREVDAILSVMQEHYNGIYCVSLDSDKARRILMPAYLNYAEDEEHFSKIFTKYIEEMVDPDFHRAITSFLNYDALKRQISEGNTPKITYKKTSGESVILTVYNLDNNSSTVNETLWIFTNN